MSKFQGQERQEDLDLGWDSFKYRNYDYAIGRFFNVDPLAEKFPYNGVYNFSENRVVDASELEGKESVIEIYDADNNKTVLDQSNYSNEDWQNIRQAYFDMTRTRENGGGDWAAYSQRQTPPEMGTLSLYYGDDGLSNVSYQSPGMGERLGHNLKLGFEGFKTTFIYNNDPLDYRGQKAVEFTNNMVVGTTFYASFFVGGSFALMGRLKMANRIQSFSNNFSLLFSLAQSSVAFSKGDNKKGFMLMVNSVVNFGSGQLFYKAIDLDPFFSQSGKLLLKGGLVTPMSYMIGKVSEVPFYLAPEEIWKNYLESLEKNNKP